MRSADIDRARSYYYEFFATPFFFYESDFKFNKWKEQLEFLSQNPLNDESEVAFKTLRDFDFSSFIREQNSILFDLSYINVPLNVSFYEEGRDDGAARLRVIDILKRTQYRRDSLKCDDSEDFVGFVFLVMATFLKDEIDLRSEQELSTELFSSVINGFINEFMDMLSNHSQSNFFKYLSVILRSFISLERALLGVCEPIVDKNTQSVAQMAINKQPYQTKMPTQKSKIHWEEFTAL